MTPWYFNPIIFEVGPIKAHWYGFMYALSFLLGYLYIKYSKRAQAIPSTQKDTFALALILGVILGGRIGYILFYNFSYFSENPLKIMAVWEGGMSFHGGLLGITTALIWFSKKYRHHLLYVGDLIASYAPLALFFGRFGNFINSELYGRIATKYCLYFPSDPANCRYPSQLLESLLEGLVLFIILQTVSKYTKKEGLISSLFLILYGVFRTIAEFFREPDKQIGYLWGGLTQGQLLSSLMIMTGLILMGFLYYQKQPSKK